LFDSVRNWPSKVDRSQKPPWWKRIDAAAKKWHGAVVPRQQPDQEDRYFLRRDYPTTEPLVKKVSGVLHISFCEQEDTIDWLYAIKYPAEALRFKYSMYLATEPAADFLPSELFAIVAEYLPVPDTKDLNSFISTHTGGTAVRLTDLTSSSSVWPHVHTLLKPPRTPLWNRDDLPHYQHLKSALLADVPPEMIPVI
jgi:hypothetical protein